jgi:phage head maturation protease
MSSRLSRPVDAVRSFAGELPGSRFVATDAATLEDPAKPITVTALAVPWNRTVVLNWWGDTVEFEPGSIAPAAPEHVTFMLDHYRTPFGFGASFEDRDGGLWATMTVPREELADADVAKALRQMSNGVRSAVSIGADILEAEETEGPDRFTSHYRVSSAELVELSSVIVPRFAEARVASVAASRPSRGAPMSTIPARRLRADDDPDGSTPTDPPDGDGDGDGEEDGDAGEEGRLEAHRRATAGAAAGRGAPARAGRGRYPTFGHFALAAARGEVEPSYLRRLEAAWSDQLVADVPGLMPEAWMRDVVDLMGTVTGTIDLFSSRPLPDAGMALHQPVLTQGPDIGRQLVEKTDIPSRKVLIADTPFPVQTFAGGQDISMQVLLRSDPSYLDELMRLYVREMGLQMNIAAGASVLAAATTSSPLDPDDINGSIIDAALIIGNATFSFPQVLLLGSAVWAMVGKAVDNAGRPLFPTYSPMNPVGSFNLTDAGGAVRDLRFAVDWSIDPDTAVLGLRDAWRSWRSPMRTLTADVPRLLGRDVAVFEFVAMGATDGRGLVKLGTTTTATGSRSSRSKAE